ncbi:MAG: hypothetical protein WCC17_19140 [Candidatus Nitrosopolaris sp.]|jgi:hypothetical protein
MDDYLAVMKEAWHQQKSNRKVSVKPLILCPRREIFSVTNPLTIPDEELCRYVLGEAAVRLFMITQPYRFRSQMYIQYENVVGRIDVYDKLFRIVIEIKTSNSTYMLKANKWVV